MKWKVDVTPLAVNNVAKFTLTSGTILVLGHGSYYTGGTEGFYPWIISSFEFA